MRVMPWVLSWVVACSGEVDSTVSVEPGPSEGGVVDAPGARPSLPVSGEPVASSAMHVVEANDLSLTLDVDRGAVLVARADFGGVNVLPVGAEPTRLARIGETSWVTLRADGELVRLGWDPEGRPVVEDRVHVGAEPFDVAPSRVAPRLYVSLSQEEAVVALDARTLEVVARWRVEGEPRWIRVVPHPEGERVVVVSSRAPRLVAIDPATGARTGTLLTLDLFAADPSGMPRSLHARFSGGPALLPDGRLVVPTVIADTDLRARPGVAPPMQLPADTGLHESDPPVTELPGDPGCSEGGGVYGQAFDPACKDPGSLGRFTPVLAVFDPLALEGAEAQVPNLLALGTLLPSGEPGTVADASTGAVAPVGRVVRGVPGDAIVADSVLGPAVWVAMPSEDAVVGVIVADPAGQIVPAEDRVVLLPPRLALPAADGVVGVHTSDSTHVRTWGWVGRAWSQTVDVRVDLAVRGAIPGMPAVLSPTTHVAGPSSPFPAHLQRGRDLFTSATEPSMVASGAGVSCDTCHVDGRSDGLTWQFDDMPRQTPALAVGINDTLPITWLGEVSSVAEEILITTTGRMGGFGPHEMDTSALAAWVAQLRRPVRPVPTVGAAAEQVARGLALFESAEVGCASCHVGEASTDGATWRVLGFDVATNTPTLRGVGASAPFFHDGSAATLRDVLLRVRDGSMGRTGHLTDAELDDLEAYLNTL